jgi:YihY family inner membrane protein
VSPEGQEALVSLRDAPERAVRRFDDIQQDRWWLAHPIGTIRKYADDRCGALAGLVTFQIFLGMLPLLVVVLTVFGRLVEGSDDLREAAIDSALRQLPVVGDRLERDVSALSADGPWLALSMAGLLWTATGIYHGLQLALNLVWNVEGVDHQGFVSRQLRALVLFTLVITASIGTAFVRGEQLPGLRPGAIADVVTALFGAVLASALLLGVFRIVVSPKVPLSRLVPAAVLAGLLWELLQSLGTWIVVERLSEAQDLYGAIGLVVVTLLWINLLARAALLANEWAVVSWRGLWPRRIAQPPLTDADRRVLVALVRNERRRPEEVIDVRFDGDPDPDPDPDADEEDERPPST